MEGVSWGNGRISLWEKRTVLTNDDKTVMSYRDILKVAVHIPDVCKSFRWVYAL